MKWHVHLRSSASTGGSRTCVVPILTSERALDSITASLGLPPFRARRKMGEPVDDGTAASCSSSLSSSSGAEEDAFHDSLREYGARAPPAAGVVGQPIPRRLWAAARAGAPRLRQACENAAGELAAWTRHGGAPRALLVVSVSRGATRTRSKSLTIKRTFFYPRLRSAVRSI